MGKLAQAHERTFGVEIECGHNRGHYTVASEMESAGFRMGGYSRGGYSVGCDGSGVEVRTPILSGKEGFKELRRIFKFLNELGCYVSDADGMHVHHGAPELIDNPALTYELVKAWTDHRPIICSMVARRRNRRAACPRWTPEQVAQMEAWALGITEIVTPNPVYRPNSRYAYERQPTISRPVDTSAPRGRMELNISALREHGTVEWRLHEGTLNIDEAEAWIMFAQKFMHKVLKGAKDMPPAANRAELLSRIRLTKKERETIEAKIARRRR